MIVRRVRGVAVQARPVRPNLRLDMGTAAGEDMRWGANG
jgi:hypothetical protein